MPIRLDDALRGLRLHDRPRSAESASLTSYLRWTSTPGLSIAVIDGGEIATTWCAGVRDASTQEAVDARSRFQAGSISKSVAAACALRLVSEGVLDLDDDVNERLRSWQIPADDRWQPRITLRQLLSHTAGLTVAGFPGYPADQPVPSLAEVLAGAGNTPPVLVTTLPGLQHSYSGGGYCVMQQLLVDVTEMPFADLAYELVLEPAGMVDSTYCQPLPPELAPTAASGHNPGGYPLPHRWNTYPEQAAAGLWSTAADLARFFVAIRNSRAGAPDALLPRDLAEQMATPHASNAPYGLGLQLSGDGGPASIGHGGSDEGYRAHAVLYDTGQGATIMTNSADGGALIHEVILPTLTERLGWPIAVAEPLPSLDADGAELAGTYRCDQGDLTLRPDGADLELCALGLPSIRLVRASDSRWRCPTLQLDATFPDPQTIVLHQHAHHVEDVVGTRV